MNSSGFPFSCFLWLLSRSLSNLHLLWAFIIHGGQKSVVFGGRKSFTWTLALLPSPMVWNHLWWFFLLAPFCPPLCLEPDLQKPSSRLPCSWAASWVCPLRGMRWSLKKKRTTMVGICFPPLLASRSGGGYVPLAHNSCSCGYLIFSGSSVRGV